MENEIKDLGKQSEDDSASTGNGRCLVYDKPADGASENSRDSLNKEVPEGDIRSLGNDEDDSHSDKTSIGQNEINLVEVIAKGEGDCPVGVLVEEEGDKDKNILTSGDDNAENVSQKDVINKSALYKSKVPGNHPIADEGVNELNTPNTSGEDVKNCTQREDLNECERSESEIPVEGLVTGELENFQNPQTPSAEDVKIGSPEEFLTDGDLAESNVTEGQLVVDEGDNGRNILTFCSSGENVKYGSENEVADDRTQGESEGCGGPLVTAGEGDNDIGITQPSSKGVECGSQVVGVDMQGSEGVACNSQLDDSFELLNIDETDGVEEELRRSPESCDKAVRTDDSQDLESSGDGSPGNERDSVNGSEEKKGAGLKSEEQEKQILPAMARQTSENEVGNGRDSVDGSGEKKGAGFKSEEQEKQILPAMARPTSENEVGNERDSVDGSGEKKGAGLKSEEQEKQILPAMARPTSENEVGNGRDSVDGSEEKKGAGLKSEEQEKKILPAMARPTLENEVGNERDSVDGSGEKKGAGLKSEEQEKQVLPAMARPTLENEVGNERGSVDGSGEKEGAGLKSEEQEKQILPAMARPTLENEVGNGRDSVDGSGEKKGAGLKSEEQEKQILPAMARPTLENEVGNGRDSVDGSGEKKGAGLKSEEQEKQILPAMARPTLENEVGNERDSVDGSGEKKGAGLKSEEQEKQILPAMARPTLENEVGNERDSVDGSGEKKGAGLKSEEQEKQILPAMARPTSENEVGNERDSVDGSGEKKGAGLKSEEQEKQILPAMARPTSENEVGNERDSVDGSEEKKGAGLKSEEQEKQILPAMARPTSENEVGNERDSVDGSEEKKGAGLKSEEQEKQILPALARPTSENEIRELSLQRSDDSVAPLDVIPSTHDTCVATVMCQLTDGLCFAELCSNIGELGRYLHLGTSIIADTATLLVKVQNALFEVIRLCDAVSLLLQNLRVSSNNIIEKLKIAFLYLLDGFPEFAKTNIVYISKDVKTMQVKSSKCLDVIGNLKDLLNENGTLRKEWTKKYEEVQVRFSKEPALFEAVIIANTEVDGFTVIVPEKPVPLESSPDEDGAEVATDASGTVKQPDEKKPTEMGGVSLLSEAAGYFQQLPLNDTAVDEVTVDSERPSPLAITSSPDEDGGKAATYGNGTTTCMKQPDERKRMEYGEVSKVRKLWGKINPWQFFGSKDKEEVPNRSTNTSSTKSDSLETTLEQERETLRDARRLHDFSNRLLLLRDALFTSLDTLNNIETTIKGTARLVDTWDVECKSVIEPWMAKEFETTQNLTPEDQAKYWKSLWFQKQAREYYNRWCALGAYCEVNTVALKKTRKEVDALYTENLLPREAIENAWRLAEGMDDDKIKKIVEKHNKEQMNK